MTVYTDKENVEIAKQEYENYSIGTEMNTESGLYVGTLSDANDNRTNSGEQIFTYTKTEGGTKEVPPTASLEERESVTEITILYRGSISPGEGIENPEEFIKDWGNNDIPTVINSSLGNEGATGQLQASSDYLKEMMEKYPNAKINIYGHSLGSMDAQYALANVTDYDRINSAHLYQGPNIYNTLTKEQKENIGMLNDKIDNYIDNRDIAGYGYSDKGDNVGRLHSFTGKLVNIKDADKRTRDEALGKNEEIPRHIRSILQKKNKIKVGDITLEVGLQDEIGDLAATISEVILVFLVQQHMWGGYSYDKEGNLLDENGKRVKSDIEKTVAVDIDRDGKLDAKFGKDRLLSKGLMPYNEKTGEIVVNYSSLMTLASNLDSLLRDISSIRNMLSISETTNNNVENRKNQRTETLEQSIVNYFEHIQVIQSIKSLDSFYSALEDKKNLFSTIMNYNNYDFVRKFDIWGKSGSMEWYDGNRNRWDYTVVEKCLNAVHSTVGNLVTSLKTMEGNVYYPESGNKIVFISARTKIAKKGEVMINSLKEDIGKVFKGEGLRSKFEDGIANPIKEVVTVEKSNIDKIEQCIVSMKNSVVAVANSYKNNDETIEKNWKERQDVLGNYQVGSVPKDFDTYVKNSGLFDDMETLKAFDKQVDNATKNLSDTVVNRLGEYFNTAKITGRTTYDYLSGAKRDADDLKKHFPTEIYYKYKDKKDDEDFHYYNRVDGCISISSNINSLSTFLEEIQTTYSEAIKTIEGTESNFYSVKSEVRGYIEDAVYSYTTLSDVVRGQRIIGMLMKKIHNQTSNFSSILNNSNKGKSITALDGRMRELGLMASHISNLVDKCFGSNGDK